MVYTNHAKNLLLQYLKIGYYTKRRILQKYYRLGIPNQKFFEGKSKTEFRYDKSIAVAKCYETGKGFCVRNAEICPKIHKFRFGSFVQLFSISTLEDVVRIPPRMFGTSLKKAGISILKEKYESMINAELGYIIMILEAKVDEMGKMIAGDGGTYHRVEFEALTFTPKLQEIVLGEIVDITDFGAFVRIGPTDALLHLSQVMDDYLQSDVKSGMIIAKQSNRTLKVGSTIRSRITAVSLGKAATMGKIGITCRQPFLGAEEWIAEEIKKSGKEGSSDKKEVKEVKVEKKEKKEK